MRAIIRVGAQGDVLLFRVRSVPKDAIEKKREDKGVVVTHSETGHDHLIKHDGVTMFEHATNPLVAYLRLDIGVDATIEHMKSYDTHETLKLLGNKKSRAVWEVRRQREHAPEGWRRVVD